MIKIYSVFQLCYFIGNITAKKVWHCNIMALLGPREQHAIHTAAYSFSLHCYIFYMLDYYIIRLVLRHVYHWVLAQCWLGLRQLREASKHILPST